MEETRISNQRELRRFIQSGNRDARLRIVNATRNTEVASKAAVAATGGKRTKGLLGRDGLERGEGLWIVPCEAVHTFFMRFSLDLVYLDRKHRVKKVRENVPPWCVSACFSAHSVLELPSGAIRESQTRRGDLIEISPAQASSTLSSV